MSDLPPSPRRDAPVAVAAERAALERARSATRDKLERFDRISGGGADALADEDLSTVEEHLTAATTGVPAVDVHLRGTGTFRPVSPVVFVTLGEGISQCERLASAVRSGPLAVDLAFPYHPHVTVAHHVSEGRLDQAFAELADFECEFAVEEFLLYVHDEVRGWTPTRYFPLRPGT